jgi:hypothetical protein
VLLAYVDESYDRDWYAMAALLTGGFAAVALSAELDRVAAAAATAYNLSKDVELHGHEIFHAKGAWTDVPIRARIGVFDDVIEAVAAQDVRVIARATDMVGQRLRYAPSCTGGHSCTRSRTSVPGRRKSQCGRG